MAVAAVVLWPRSGVLRRWLGLVWRLGKWLLLMPAQSTIPPNATRLARFPPLGGPMLLLHPDRARYPIYSQPPDTAFFFPPPGYYSPAPRPRPGPGPGPGPGPSPGPGPTPPGPGPDPDGPHVS